MANNIGLIIFATGDYTKYLKPLIKSARRNFLLCTFIIFSDKKPNFRNSIFIKTEHLPFPLSTLLRYHRISAHSKILSKFKYLFYIDADTLFVNKVGTEILSDLVATQHCGYVNRRGTYEMNPISTAYTRLCEGKIYFAGGFNGGISERFLAMSRDIVEMINKDLLKNYIALWHDESYLNRYLIDNPPTKILSPEYHYPEDSPEHYQKIWGENKYTPRILLLKK